MESQEEIVDDLIIAEKNWNKIIDKAKTMGYREGIMDGKESVYQENFEIGYEHGFQNGKAVGMKQGLSTGHKLFTESVSDQHNKIVAKKFEENCAICQNSSLLSRPISEVIKTQYSYFQDNVKAIP